MKFVDLIVKTVQRFGRHHGPSYAAAIAYHTIISLGPLLFFSLFLSAQLFSWEAALQQMEGAIASIAGETLVDLLSTILTEVGQPVENTLWTTGISLVLLFFATSNVFRQLVIAQNAIWEVEPPEVSIRDNFWHWVVVRLRIYVVGLITALVIMLLLPGTMILGVIATFLLSLLEIIAPGLTTMVTWLSFVLIPLTLIILCLLGFRLLPVVSPPWRAVLPGAIITGLVLAVGEGAIVYYASNNPIPTFFGIAQSAVIVMLWAYFSAFIFLLGAEFTRTYTIDFTGGNAPFKGDRRSGMAGGADR
jgi:membrane protein